MHKLKNFFFGSVKWVDISKETYENNDIEIIVDDNGTWLNEKHIVEKLRHKNLPVITNTIQYIKGIDMN